MEKTDKDKPLDEEGLYLKLKENFLADARHSAEWRKQATKDFDFVAGEQWEKETVKTLQDQQRVPITFNLSLGIIKAVAGLEINGRHETIFYPRDTSEGDVVANEMLNGCSKWMGQNCDAEDEQSEGFQDDLVCGMGWTESRMDYELDPEGVYIEEKCDPIEMYWDRSARAQNLRDSRRMWRVRKMSLDDAKALCERLDIKASDDDLNASWAVGHDMPGDPVPVENRALREGNDKGPLPDDEVHIVQAQWWERESYHRVANPFTGKIENLNDAELDELRARATEYYEINSIELPVEAAKMTKRVYKQAFLGKKILGGVRQCPRPDGFTFNCMTGQLHKNKGTWFGLITLVREPQMMANKWLSQTQHILNTTAKGGILAERSAFRDVREAQSTYARPDAVTLVEDGAIASGKIMQKPGAGIVGPYLQLLEYAVSGVWRVTGMNPEIMGMADVNQPGVLEQHRKQAAMTILSTLFNALRRYRKEIGRTRLTFIQRFLSDGRIIRIIGESGNPKAVRLLRERTLGQYDVVVDDSPTSPNVKEQTFAMLMQLLPHLRGQGLSPEMIIIFLEYSPLPREAVAQFKKILMKPPGPEQQQQQQLAIAGAQAKIGRDVAAAEKDKATAAESRADAVLQLAQAGVHASAKELNRVKTAAVGMKMMRDAFDGMGDLGVMPDQSPHQLPMPRQVPAAPQQPGMLSIDEIVSQVQPESPAQGPV